MTLLRILFLLTLCITLEACSREPTLPNGHLETVRAETVANTLFYSGTIQPMATHVVTSPVDGAIINMPFQYGEMVKQDQTLFLISSAKFLADYKAALLQYVKAKSEFNNGQTQLKEAEFLHKNELISDDDYKMKQSTYYASQLGLLQARDAMELLLRQTDIKDVNLNTLTIADIDKITQAMHLQKKSENIRITAPANGVVLSASKSEDDSKKFFNGDAVKQGDVLAIIGNMTGLAVRVRVNELVVNQLKVGQKVKVTGIAFPEYILNGTIARVDHQGEASNGGLPTFTVQIVVAALTPEEQAKIHAGMSSQVEIDISESNQITVPIHALQEKAGKSYVQIYNRKKHKLEDILVRTGKTSQESVTILSGLKVGDRIVVPA